MFYIFIAFIAFVWTAAAYPTDQQCGVYERNAAEIATKCTGKDSELVSKLAVDWQKPFEVICSNVEEVVDLIHCMQNEVIGCLSYRDEMMAILPTRERLLDGVKFICNNKAELIDNKCMESTHVQHMQCLVSKMYTLKTYLGEPRKENIQTALCSIFKAQEQCYKLFHGDCSAQLLDLAYQTYDKLFRLDICNANNTLSELPENMAVTNLLRSLLLPSKQETSQFDIRQDGKDSRQDQSQSGPRQDESQSGPRQDESRFGPRQDESRFGPRQDQSQFDRRQEKSQ